jgi:hypothetical protein
MHRATVTFPSKLDLGSIFSFARELDYFSQHDELTIDMGEAKFFSPFGMLFLAAKIARMRTGNPDLKVSLKRHQQHVYPAHVGFFRMFGVDYGRDPGEAWGSENYLPITHLDREAFYTSPTDKYEEFPDLVQRQADQIAKVITRDKPEHGVMFDALSYSIREVMRNVFEHSEAEGLFYCTQYWPKSNRVEFALADLGIGIRRGLGQNPNFRFPSDKQAIEYSLLPSVSGKTHLPRSSATWFNSGYGLYMTNRLARNGGNFVLASGATAIHLSRKSKSNYETSFPGTALRFNLDVAQIGNVQSRLQEFRKEGAEIAKTIAGTGNRPPSAMSLLLRRDYGS